MNIFQDVKTVVRLVGEIRGARKAGADAIQIQPVRNIPSYRLSYWGSTMEGCLFYDPKWQPLREVFDSFSENTQHALTFSPKDGEWCDRVRFWQQELRDALEPNLYHEAMRTLLGWYIRCVRARREGAIS